MNKQRIGWILILCLLLAGCQSSKEEEGAGKIYYVNYDKGAIESNSYKFASEEQEDMVDNLVDMLSNAVPKEEEESGAEALLPDKVKILGYEITGEIMKLNLSEAYLEIVPVHEVLCRAALVKNFVQIPDISYVQIMVEGKDLLDSKGNVIGLMSSDSFLETSGKDITAYQYAELELYFANKDGDKLEKETRNVYYSSNTPLEKVVVEQLIKGPREEGHYAVISPNTKIIGVSVADGIGYVNLDEQFAADPLVVQEEVPIYAIVNSLTSAGNVQKVQISVNGDTKITFRESMRLDQLYEKNEELMDTEVTE